MKTTIDWETVVKGGGGIAGELSFWKEAARWNGNGAEQSGPMKRIASYDCFRLGSADCRLSNWINSESQIGGGDLSPSRREHGRVAAAADSSQPAPFR